MQFLIEMLYKCIILGMVWRDGTDGDRDDRRLLELLELLKQLGLLFS